MDRIKSFSGEVGDISTTKIIKPYYGLDNQMSGVSVGKTDLVNGLLADFLTECGASAKYDGNYLWVNGLPITIQYSPSSAYGTLYFPFVAQTQATSNHMSVFSGASYSFKARILGEPTRAFYLVTSSNYQSPSFSSSIGFFRAKNIINERDAMIYCLGNAVSIRAVDFGDDGLPVDVGRSSYTQSVKTDLESLAVDYGNNPNKFPLLEWCPGIFKVNGCYCNLPNSSIPAAAAQTADVQTFVKLGDDVYYRCLSGPLIKCAT